MGERRVASHHDSTAVLGRLAAHGVAIGERDLPADVWHAARRSLVDWFAATIPGGGAPPATLLRAALAEDLGRGDARLVPSGERTTARTAALVNGAAAHTIEFDDIYRDALYHPGAPVIAAALAVAQARGATGAQLLRGVVAGYEVSTRIGVAINPTHYEFWHTTGTVGTLGAAAAAACILGLDAARTAHAIATAATMAAGLQQAFRSDAMSKPIHAGRAAEGGVLAALAAAHGVTGAHDILEGARGFGRAMGGDPDWLAAASDLDSTFNITRVTVKNHAACGHTHAALDAVRTLRERHRLAAAEVDRMQIGTYAKALEVTGNRDPRTPFEAQFSLSYCAAVMLVDGSARLGAFTPERLQDDALRTLMARIETAADPEAEAAFPRRRAASVTIVMRNGDVFVERAPTRKGDPDHPLTDAELEDKFHELVDPVIGAPASQALLEALWRLDQQHDVSHLTVHAAGDRAARGAHV